MRNKLVQKVHETWVVATGDRQLTQEKQHAEEQKRLWDKHKKTDKQRQSECSNISNTFILAVIHSLKGG